MKRMIISLVILMVPVILMAQDPTPDPGGLDLWHWISIAIAGVGSIFGGTRWFQKIKNKLAEKTEELFAVGREVDEFRTEIRELTVAADRVLNNPNPSKEDLKQVVKEAKDIGPAVDELWDAIKDLVTPDKPK